MRLTFVGSGDAFGTGGRFHTCFHVVSDSGSYLIDCGASSPVGLKQHGLTSDDIDAIFVSHLHGDHFGGLPFLLLDCQFLSQRQRPLRLIGPEGFADRLRLLHETMYPGTWEVLSRFKLEITEVPAGQERTIAGATVRTYEVLHPSGAPSLALRFVIDGRVVAFSGDTEWVDVLREVAADADLFICDCTGYMDPSPTHINYRTFLEHRDTLRAKRIVLTHLGPKMLEASKSIDEPGVEFAVDGLVIEL